MATRRLAVVLVSTMVLAAACGDDDSGDGAADGVTAATDASDATSSETGTVAAEDESGGSGATSGDGLTCQALFSDEEVEAVFGEPFQLLDSFDPELGLLLCSWETLDAAEDDFTFTVLTTQVFTGDPVPATSFYDPTLFDDSTPVEGVGDEAFYSEAGGFYFLAGDVGGALSLTEGDMTSTDDVSRPVEEVESLFGTFADRVIAVS